MVMLSVGILTLQKDSKFAGFYNSGKFNKMTAWEYVYEDASDLVARIAIIAAFIYNLKYRDDKQIAIDRITSYNVCYTKLLRFNKGTRRRVIQ